MLLQTVPVENPNFERCEENRARLRQRASRSSSCRTSRTSRSPAKQVAAGYLNLYVCNGAVIVPDAGADTDADALLIIARRFPDREIVAVPAPCSLTAAAGPHCITQQVPRARTEPDLPNCIYRLPPPPSPARTRPPTRAPLRVGARPAALARDPDEHEAALANGIRIAAGEGARIVCLQELTLSPYFAITPGRARGARRRARGPRDRPDDRLRADGSPRETGAYVHASLYERADGADGLGYNTAIVVAPDGRLVARTRKLHIPVTAGYYEDRYFRPGPADGDPFPLATIDEADGAAQLGARRAGTSGSPSSPAPTR